MATYDVQTSAGSVMTDSNRSVAVGVGGQALDVGVRADLERGRAERRLLGRLGDDHAGRIAGNRGDPQRAVDLTSGQSLGHRVALDEPVAQRRSHRAEAVEVAGG